MDTVATERLSLSLPPPPPPPPPRQRERRVREILAEKEKWMLIAVLQTFVCFSRASPSPASSSLFPWAAAYFVVENVICRYVGDFLLRLLFFVVLIVRLVLHPLFDIISSLWQNSDVCRSEISR